MNSEGKFIYRLRSLKCYVKSNSYYQTLTPECLGKCCCSKSATKKIDRIRGIPNTGNTISPGLYHTNSLVMSHGSIYRRGKGRVTKNTAELNAFRQHSQMGRCHNKVLNNF